MRFVNLLALAAGALALALPPSANEGRWSAPRLLDALDAADNGSFRFETDARDSLRTLWLVSINAHQERVACIGGERRSGVAYITRVKPLVPSAADSLHISAETSLTQCGGPEWFGTVHTHVAKFQGLPFVTFSPADRGVMTMWRKRWQDEGVFCVLYSQTEAHCEAGPEQSDDPIYALEPYDPGVGMGASPGTPPPRPHPERPLPIILLP